jgi:hypothetical protein
MSDNLGMNTKNMVMLLAMYCGPFIVLLAMFVTAYFVGDCEGHQRGVRETDCKNRGGHIVNNECVKRVE